VQEQVLVRTGLQIRDLGISMHKRALGGLQDAGLKNRMQEYI
jgi:hypothetical protein